MDTSSWLPKGSRRRSVFGFCLVWAGLLLGVFVIDTFMRGGFPLTP